MQVTHTSWFQRICRIVLFTFIFSLFHPATLRVPWPLGFSFSYFSDSGHWTLDSGLFSINFGPWTLDFGLSSVYGQTSQNVPPIANAGADQQIALSTEVSLDARSSSDPDKGPQPLTYSWRLVSKPASSQVTDADITNFETATAKFLPDVAGRYELQVEVFDGAASVKDMVVIDAVGVDNVSTKVQVTSANERTTLDRATRQLTSRQISRSPTSQPTRLTCRSR